MNTKSFLFVFTKTPHSGSSAKEGMDFAFSCAAFEQKVDAVFMGDAVLQLVKNQQSDAISVKNHSAAIEAFELYGIANCFYDEKSLLDCGLDKNDLIESANLLPANFWDNSKQYDYILKY